MLRNISEKFFCLQIEHCTETSVSLEYIGRFPSTFWEVKAKEKFNLFCDFVQPEKNSLNSVTVPLDAEEAVSYTTQKLRNKLKQRWK